MAMGLAGSDRRCHGWMVRRDRLDCLHARSIALPVDLETLSCLHRRAKDHAPQGNVDFKCIPHWFAPRRLVEPTLET